MDTMVVSMQMVELQKKKKKNERARKRLEIEIREINNSKLNGDICQSAGILN